jgi:F-type H+-transporting ATPase subunit gamma
MADKLPDLVARLASVGELHELVGAMRALAAARLQQAEAVLPAMRAYAAVVAAA